MRIFLAGVSCVGKTTIGAQLAGLLECRFFDLDIENRAFLRDVDRAPSKPSPDVTRFPARGVTSLETRAFSGGQLQLGHCVAAEWAAGWLLEGCQRKAERHHRRASRYAGEYSQEDHVLRHRLPSVA